MPDWRPLLAPRLAGLHLPPAREREIVEEISQHLDDRYRELGSAGASSEEAMRLALEDLDEEGLLARELRSLSGTARPMDIPPGVPPRALLGDAWRDLVYGARLFRRSPGFAAVAFLTLALAIGATTAVFTVVNGVLLRPLPYPDPERIVRLWEQSARDPGEARALSSGDRARDEVHVRQAT